MKKNEVTKIRLAISYLTTLVTTKFLTISVPKKTRGKIFGSRCPKRWFTTGWSRKLPSTNVFREKLTAILILMFNRISKTKLKFSETAKMMCFWIILNVIKIFKAPRSINFKNPRIRKNVNLTLDCSDWNKLQKEIH